MSTDESATRQAPRSPSHLFVAFTVLALQGFGGVFAVVQRELVERRKWLTQEEFLEDWSVAQILPGPNVVNLSLMIGSRHFGLRGAIAALAGMFSAPLVVLLTLSMVYMSVADHPAAQGALRGMGAVVAGLVAATGIKLIDALKDNAMGQSSCALFGVLSFAAVVLMRLPLMIVLLSVGAVAWTWAYRRLPPATPSTPEASLKP